MRVHRWEQALYAVLERKVESLGGEVADDLHAARVSAAK